MQGRDRLANSVSAGMGVSAAAGAILRETAAWALQTFADRLTDYEVSIWAIRAAIDAGVFNVAQHHPPLTAR